MKAVAFVLTILFFVSMFNLLYNPDTAGGFGFGSIAFGSGGVGEVLYDESGHEVCYLNGSAIGEDGEMLSGLGAEGWLSIRPSIVTGKDCDYMWANTTNPMYNPEAVFPMNQYGAPYYPLFSSPSGEPSSNLFYNFFLGSQLGFLSVIAIIMVVVMIVGIQVFGSGISEFSVMSFVKGSTYLGLFVALSAYSYSAILGINFGGFPVGTVIYFGLTGIYMMGCMGSFGIGGAD